MDNKIVVAQRSTPYLFLAFVGLLIAKLGFGVNIAWLWVFAPLWVPVVAVIAVFLAVLIAGGAFLGLAALFSRR